MLGLLSLPGEKSDNGGTRPPERFYSNRRCGNSELVYTMSKRYFPAHCFLRGTPEKSPAARKLHLDMPTSLQSRGAPSICLVYKAGLRLEPVHECVAVFVPTRWETIRQFVVRGFSSRNTTAPFYPKHVTCCSPRVMNAHFRHGHGRLMQHGSDREAMGPHHAGASEDVARSRKGQTNLVSQQVEHQVDKICLWQRRVISRGAWRV